MPTIAPNYIYAFFALIAVSSILISAFAAYATTLRTIPEIEQLENLLSHIATEGYKLITLTMVTNSTSEVTLQLPSTIGNKRYWIRLCNESTKAWVEGGLGDIQKLTVQNRIYLPKTVSASGHYSSSHGPASLECEMNGFTIKLYLRNWREST